MKWAEWTKSTNALRRQVKTPASTSVRTRHKAVVVTTSPLTIYLDGVTSVAVSAHCLAGYTPVISDVVFVDNVGGDLVVINKYAS